MVFDPRVPNLHPLDRCNHERRKLRCCSATNTVTFRNARPNTAIITGARFCALSANNQTIACTIFTHTKKELGLDFLGLG